MAIAEELARVGFAVTGSPPTTKIVVGHDEVVVRVTEVAEVRDAVHLRAELPVEAMPSSADLSGATISASGDTTLAMSGSTLLATRRLVAPGPGLLYDAIYELAKTIAAAARLLREMAEYEANAPAATEPTAAMAEVPYPTPAAPAPAPPPPAPPPPASPTPGAAPPPPSAGAQGAAITAPVPSAPAPAPPPPSGAFTPTHSVPAGGLPAWISPDASQPAAATLDPGLAVQLAETHGGWGRIICENTWSAWVDASKLLPR